MRDESHSEQIERWAEFVKNNPREKWKPVVNALINAQYQVARKFYSNLEKTPEGRKILERLKEERIRKRRV